MNLPSYSEEHLNAEAKIQWQGSPCGICGGYNFTKTSSSPTSFSALSTVQFHQRPLLIVIYVYDAV
jgi:hypothetical protein